MTPRRHHLVRLPLVLPALALTLVASGCGARSADRAGGAERSPDPAATATTSTTTPHRRSQGHSPGTSKSTPPAADNRIAPRGYYDDSTGTRKHAPHDQRIVLAHLPGSKKSRCVNVGDQHDVRSGALAMGDFATARSTYDATNGAYDADPTHLYVVPSDRATKRVALTLTRVGGGAPPIRVASHQVEQAAQWLFFPISVAITRPGTWRIQVSAGSAHGCFVTTFRR